MYLVIVPVPCDVSRPTTEVNVAFVHLHKSDSWKNKSPMARKIIRMKSWVFLRRAETELV
jgi:hypothetical protein